MLPFMQEELVDWLAADQEDACDQRRHAGTPGLRLRRRRPAAQLGRLRKLALAAAKTDVSNAAPTVANSIRVNRKKMGKYGVRPANLAHSSRSTRTSSCSPTRR
jgi:hypothetical protein